MHMYIVEISESTQEEMSMLLGEVKRTPRKSTILCTTTVFPRNLAAATFNFVVQFGAATFRGRPDFEGGD